MDNKFLKIIITIVTVIYFISPVDLIPDPTPAIGFLDDIVAICLCCKSILGSREKRWNFLVEYRDVKVYKQYSSNYKVVPEIRLKGEWLKRFGFIPDSYVTVRCEDSKLTIILKQ